MEHRERGREIGDGEIGAGEPQQRRQQQPERDPDQTGDEHRDNRRRLIMHHQDRKSVRAGAEEADIAERQIAGEPIDDVHALGEDQEDDEIEQQQMVLVDARQHREDGEQRHDDEEHMLESARQRAPAFRADRSDEAAG